MKHHLIYHITPMGNWRTNLEYLKSYINIFDGVKLAVVYQGDGLTPIEEISSELTMFDEVWPLKNNKDLREMPSMLFLLEKLWRRTQDGIAFFGHTKGVTRGDDPAIKLWTQACYNKNLGDMDAVHTALKTYHTVGSFRRLGRFPNFPPQCLWHYSGTFFWFNVAELWSRHWRKALQHHRYGAEAFPGMVFKLEESACLFADKTGSMYRLANIETVLAGGTLREGRALGEGVILKSRAG